jgi:hypothetical protein
VGRWLDEVKPWGAGQGEDPLELVDLARSIVRVEGEAGLAV